ncbi:helicase-associated domain-containing protein [Dactylosporangium roseum]|uniref:Helicase-associated domain-containing protein n=2 Tax=Dactylosporangium roseum TaxID=47989 RepID=A0ABY5Z2H9_9ACTN|nr:helicase-associated domain-containing protein [Dactylosporangium roseum]UWZ36233.1 helicase-associated domain-containing protein [Dactylosporangium roseum]
MHGANELPDVDEAADDATVRLTGAEALANVLAVLQLCGAGKLRCSEKTQRPSAATVAGVAEVLAGGDFYPTEPIAAFAWPLLIQAGGLAELAGSRLHLTAKGHAALGRPPAETIRTLWRSWVGKAVIDELSRVEHIKGQRTANTLTSAKTRRQAVAAALSRCPAGEWVAIDDLFDTMRRGGLSPTVARSDRALWRLYFADPEYGSLGYAGYADWPILEGRYTLAVLFEYAGTLGLFDLDYTDPAGARDDFRGNWGTDELEYLSRYDGLRAVRLNALGAYALGLTDRYQAPTADAAVAGALKVLPNLDIVVTGELPPADRLMLDAYAQRTADRVWALREATLLAALDAGRRLDQLREFLAARATHELPNAVTTLLADVTARTGRLRSLGVVRLVECADPALAVLIAGDRRLRGLCQPVGDRHLAVTVDRDPEFRKALRALGHVLPSDTPA